MSECHPVATPMVAGLKLQKLDECKGTSVHSLTSPVSNYVYMYSPRSPHISDHIYTTPISSR
jgi:hypothetical protein